MPNRITGKDVLNVVIAGGVIYGLYKISQGAGALSRFWSNLTFTPESLGPVATLTPEAKLSMEEYIKRGYYAINPRTGNYEITPLGNEYIERQKALQSLSGYRR